MSFTQARRWDGVGRGGQGKGLINRAQPGFELRGGGSCCVGQAGLSSWGSGTCIGCLVPVLHWQDGGFAEEAVLVVHQVLVDAGSATGGHARSQCIPPCPQAAHCAHGAHVLAGLVATGLEHSRDGVSVADGAEVFLTGGLQGAECRVGWVRRPDKWVCTTPTVVLMCSELVWPRVLWPHSPGRQLPPVQMQRLGVPASVPPGPAPPHWCNLYLRWGWGGSRVRPNGASDPGASWVFPAWEFALKTTDPTQPQIPVFPDPPLAHLQLCREKCFRSGAGRAVPGAGGSGCPSR